MSSSSEKPKRRHTTAGGYKRSLNFCSTPKVGKITKRSSISISAVDTNSSSSTKEQSKNQILLKSNQKRPVRKRKLQQKKRRYKKKLRQKVKESPESEKKQRKKRKSVVQINSDKDWETCEEDTRQPSFWKTTSGSESDALFKDLGSPERVREAPRFVESRLDSPISGHRGWEAESPERISFEKDEGVPLKDLPCPHLRLEDTDDEEDVLFLRKDNTVKTYLGLRNEKRNKNEMKIEKCKQWLVDVSVPTASSDLLWDNFVRDNHQSISKYLAIPGNNTQELKRRKRRSNESNTNESFEELDDHGKKLVKKKENLKPELREKMDIVHGYWDKSLQKWVRVYDVYSYSESKDVEIEGKNGKMTLNQFLQKCRAQKENLVELGPSSSCSTHLQSVEKNVKNLESTLDKGKRKHSESFMSKSKSSKMAMPNVIDLELERINKIRKFASRLNAKEKAMISNEVSLASTSKSTKLDRTSSLKRKRERGIDDREDCKRQKQTNPKNKPVIKSMQSLTAVQFKKDKQNWRII